MIHATATNPFAETTVVNAKETAAPKGGASDKQLVFIRKLIVEKGYDGDVELDTLTKAEASTLIDTLLKLPTPGDTTFRWTKVDGAWAVRGPWAEVGDTITVTKKDGTEATKLVAEVYSRTADQGTYRVEDPAEVAAPGVSLEGFHEFNGEVFKVQRAVHGSGKLYAKKLNPESGGFAYVGREPLKKLGEDTFLTLERAKELGHLYGMCCICGLTLTNESSIEAGIGPVCASKF